MPAKSIHKPEYQAFLDLLLDIREKSGLTQAQLAVQLQHSQSYVSDVERGIRRLDILQLRDYCLACGQDFVAFVRRFDKAIS